MGNCIHFMFHQSQEKIIVVIFKGGVQEFKASTPVEEITSGPYIGYKLVHQAQPHTPLPPNVKLEPGEVYHLVPDLASLGLAHQESCKRQKVKIVVTREQLEFLLMSANKFKSKGEQLEFLLMTANKFKSKEIGVRLSGRFGLQTAAKWRPSLAIIPEVHNS